jgi:2-polyprenyl-6-methoxyphenol hydroxylase-like FAD-dependent oxidoreductase
MAGVLPIGKQSANGHSQAAFFWSLKRSDLNAWRARGLAAWRADIEKLWPDAVAVTNHIDDINQVTFAQYDHFTATTPYARQLAQIGDAAHATSPQLGQGANMALLDAFALAHALDNNATIAEALDHYARLRRWHVRLFQWASAMFTPFYQSDNRVLPFVRDWITAPLSRLPIGDRIVARLVSGMTTAPLRGANFAPFRIDARQ